MVPKSDTHYFYHSNQIFPFQMLRVFDIQCPSSLHSGFSSRNASWSGAVGCDRFLGHLPQLVQSRKLPPRTSLQTPHLHSSYNPATL